MRIAEEALDRHRQQQAEKNRRRYAVQIRASGLEMPKIRILRVRGPFTEVDPAGTPPPAPCQVAADCGKGGSEEQRRFE
jgi:hypothetical protein